MDSKEYLSIKEFALKVGISQQAVYKQLNNKLQKYVKVVENKKYLHISALNEYLNMDNKQPDEQQLLNLLQTTISTLQDQLNRKDEQIANFQKQLDQEQQLRAMYQQQILELEQKEVEEPQAEPQKRWWNKFF